MLRHPAQKWASKEFLPGAPESRSQPTPRCGGESYEPQPVGRGQQAAAPGGGCNGTLHSGMGALHSSTPAWEPHPRRKQPPYWGDADLSPARIRSSELPPLSRWGTRPLPWKSVTSMLGVGGDQSGVVGCLPGPSTRPPAQLAFSKYLYDE